MPYVRTWKRGTNRIHQDFDIIHHQKTRLIVEAIVGCTNSRFINSVDPDNTRNGSTLQQLASCRVWAYHVIVPRRVPLKTNLKTFFSWAGSCVWLRICTGTNRITRSMGTLTPIHTTLISYAIYSIFMQLTPSEYIVVDARR